MRTDRRKNMKPTGVSATIQTRIKSHVTEEKEELQRSISVALNQWGQEAMYDILPDTRSS
jgi:hypothetical protein